MEVLRVVKVGRGSELRLDALSQPSQPVLGFGALSGCVVVDAVSVLRSLVVPHLVQEIDVVPQPLHGDADEFAEGHEVGIVHHHDGLRVSRGALAHVVVAGMGCVALRIAHLGTDDARRAHKGQLARPETAQALQK